MAGGERGGPTDFALWESVIQSVQPLKLKRRSAPVPPRRAALIATPKRAAVVVQPPYHPPTPVGAIEPNMRKNLGRGRLPIDATLDLHGMHQGEALAALLRFVSVRIARGDRTLLIITGKGLARSESEQPPRERGILRAMLPIWLGGPELRGLVSGWTPSAPVHGGTGAWYVRLRRSDRR